MNKDIVEIPKNDPVTTEEAFTEEMALEVAKEMGLGAESNERIMKLREILNGNIPDELLEEDKEVSPDFFDSGVEGLDLFKESTNTSTSIIDIAINGINENKIDISEITAAAKETLGGEVCDDDIKVMLNIAKRYKDGEDFSVYNAFPEVIKNMVKRESAGMDKSSINLFSKMLLEEFSSAVFGVAIEKEAVDFNEAIAKALDIPDITIMYEDHIKAKMEVELMKKAAALDAEFPDGAAVLRAVSQAFTDSYTFNRQRDAIKGKVRRKLYKDNEFFPRFCHEFNARNEKSKFKINDVFEMGRVLYKVMQVVDSGVTEEDIVMFVILFIKTCDNYDTTSTADCTFMYYTIRNIINMEHHGFIDGGGFKPSAFDTEILNNIVKLIDDIHVIINERGIK